MAVKPTRRAARMRLLVVLIAAAVPVAAGLFLIGESWSNRLPIEARLGTMGLVLERAIWLEDHSSHGPGFAMPNAMTPDLPQRGLRRFSLELTGFAVDQEAEFGPGEISLVDDEGNRFEPSAVEVGDVVLARGQSVTNTLQFDIPARAQPLKVVWEREDATLAVYSTRAPNVVVETEEKPRWPERFEELPPGDPERGAQLYSGRFACNSCHGVPEAPGGNNAGPHIAGIGQRASTRVEGKTAGQYLYESMLDPNAFIAPECPNGTTCLSPSAMPYYGDMMEPQDLADIAAYLMR